MVMPIMISMGRCATLITRACGKTEARPILF